MKLSVPVALCVCGSLLGAADLSTVEEIVAKCNGDIITRTDLARARQQLITELRENGSNGATLEAALAEREKNILRDKIDQLLLVQKGKDLNINVDGELSK